MTFGDLISAGALAPNWICPNMVPKEIGSRNYGANIY